MKITEKNTYAVWVQCAKTKKWKEIQVPYEDADATVTFGNNIRFLKSNNKESHRQADVLAKVNENENKAD